MKKTLIALAALAATGAFAQSSVTLYGTVDAGLNHMKGNGNTVTSVNNSQLGSSKLGFMGTEDLGGGLKAIFKLEGGLKNESGNGKTSNTNNQSTGLNTATANGSQGLDFQRYSYVGLAGNFGELHIGREYIQSFQLGEGVLDVFGTNGPASATNMFYKLAGGAIVGLNTSNMLTYISPVGPVQGGVQYFLGGNTAASTVAVGHNDGTGYSAYLAYNQGPVFIDIAASKTEYLVAGDYKVVAFNASYDFGKAKVMYTYAKEQQAATVATANTTNELGVSVPMGATTWKASYIHANRTGNTTSTSLVSAAGTGNQYGLGVDYALSKRTKLYTTVAEVTNNGSGNGLFSTGTVGASTGSKSGNIAIGVFSAF